MKTDTADRLPRVFWIVFAGQLVNRIGSMVATFLVFYLTSRGLTVAGIGVVTTALGVGGLLSQPVGGFLADRFGHRLTLIAGMVATAGCMGALGAAQNLPLLAISAAALGFVGDLYRPAAAALVAEVVPLRRRSYAYGLIFWAINLGYPVAGVSAGLLAAHGFWLLFATDAFTCLLFAGIIALGIPATVDRRPAGGRPLVGYRTAFADFRLRWLVILTCGYFVVYSQVFFGLPLAITGAGLPPSSFGPIVVVNGVGIVCLQPFASRLLARFAPLRVLGVSWLFVGTGMGLVGFAHTTTEFALAAVVWTVGEVGAGGVAAGLVANLAPTGAHGRYQALYGWSQAVAKVIAGAVGPAVYVTAGPAALSIGCVVVALGCCVTAFRVAPAFHRPSSRNIPCADRQDARRAAC
ncbi:MFS transporter [Fodinicola feengrottensis]|uniref:MFS transporter n=1 Tax=Fodinicola feengrottensis TaxID=435914 RepID=UPI0031D0E20F